MALDFSEFQKIVETAQKADVTKAELKRALKKVNSAIEALQVALGDVNEILSDDYAPATTAKKERKPRTPKALGESAEVDPEAPYGRKADGTPKAKSGRTKAKAETAA